MSKIGVEFLSTQRVAITLCFDTHCSLYFVIYSLFAILLPSGLISSPNLLYKPLHLVIFAELKSDTVQMNVFCILLYLFDFSLNNLQTLLLQTGLSQKWSLKWCAQMMRHIYFSDTAQQ